MDVRAGAESSWNRQDCVPKWNRSGEITEKLLRKFINEEVFHFEIHWNENGTPDPEAPTSAESGSSQCSETARRRRMMAAAHRHRQRKAGSVRKAPG